MGVEIGKKLPFSSTPPLRSPEWTARVSKRLVCFMATILTYRARSLRGRVVEDRIDHVEAYVEEYPRSGERIRGKQNERSTRTIRCCRA